MKKGVGVSSGVVSAPAYVLQAAPAAAGPAAVGTPEEELNKFEQARQSVLREQRRLYEKALRETGAATAEVFDAHCTILEDEDSIVEPTNACIREEGLSAYEAVDRCFGELYEVFTSFDDAYMRERASDILDLRKQLLGVLSGTAARLSLPGPCIVVAEDLTPSETMQMDTSLVTGFLLSSGGPTSHTSILARALGVPAVVGCGELSGVISSGDTVWIDGDSGSYAVNPQAEETAWFEQARQASEARRRLQECYRGRVTSTADGHIIDLCANVTSPEVIAAAVENDAEGIGLFRSEFLYMGRDTLPDEETQFAAYKLALEQMSPAPVIIRTMDIGGDKDVPPLELKKEENPFLGYRAIRICLRRPDLFRTQLRALLRASVYGQLWIMFPMISRLQEFLDARQAVSNVRAELLAEGIPVAENVKTGMMVEVPSAAVMADQFARYADFFSIGTNDLTQYTLATDRNNESISDLYSTYDPGVLRLIKLTADAAEVNGIPCGMCGEAAGNQLLVPVWIGMGLTELSVSPASVLPVRARIAGLRRTGCQALVKEVLKCSDRADVESLLQGYAEAHGNGRDA